MGTLEYHLKELEIARDSSHEMHILPEILDSDEKILDVGCGIGQSFLALKCLDRTCVGFDVDEEAVRYGMKNYGDKIHYFLSDAKHIPLPPNTFHLIYSRVSLPYMNIPKAIQEMRRVLRPNGRVWMTLHNRERAGKYLKDAIASRSLKRLVHVTYILLNGYLLKYFGVVLPFLNGSYESWQDIPAMKRLLMRHGFDVNVREKGRHVVIEGHLRLSE